MKKCELCGTEITSKNNGFSDYLDNEERKRLLKLKCNQTICNECKYITLAINIISPF
jgi:hypothetical protein